MDIDKKEGEYWGKSYTCSCNIHDDNWRRTKLLENWILKLDMNFLSGYETGKHILHGRASGMEARNLWESSF